MAKQQSIGGANLNLATSRLFPLPQGRLRSGKVLVIVLITLPVLMAMMMLVLDGSEVVVTSRELQHVADAAATAAAHELKTSGDVNATAQIARDYVHSHNGLADANVEVNIPPLRGPYAGQDDHVEVTIARDCRNYFSPMVRGEKAAPISARSVAGVRESTSAAALVVLDEDPGPLSIGPLSIPLLPAMPSLLGGLEVLGAGRVSVDGAVHVNTRWGAKDEHGSKAGLGAGPPYGVSCMPLLPLTKLRARDIRVAGGVDNPQNFGPLVSSSRSPLTANCQPVPDPLIELPVPTVNADPINVVNTYRGGRTIVGIPILGVLLPTRLYPGTYDWIDIVSGHVIFEPGVYVIRGKNPVTQIPLTVLAGEVHANGVMFYITNSNGYSASAGFPDESDGETKPQQAGLIQSVGNLLPSALINIGLLGSEFSGLNSPGSPFDGMIIYQRRLDRRPLILLHDGLLTSGSFRGRIYAKWGHVILAGRGTYDTSIVAGTMRVIALLDMTIAPQDKLPPAKDVYLLD